MIKTILPMLLLIMVFHTSSYAVTYYVDMTSGNDSRTCTTCQSSATPKKTVQNLLDNCALAPGDTVKIKGSAASGTGGFTVSGNDDGGAVHALETVSSLQGSIVTFSTPPSGVSTITDYVMIYNSLKGNSGAFKVTGTNGAQVAVDTSRLPGGTFMPESSSDARPAGLTVIQGIVVRPVSFEAWDDNNIPVWTDLEKVIYVGSSGNPSHYLRFYKLKSVSTDNSAWCMFQCQYGSQYSIFDSCERQGGRNFWFIEFGPNHSNTNRHIIQYCNIHDWSSDSGVNSSEAFYVGNDPAGGTPGSGYNYIQIMYNRIHGNQMTTSVNQNNAIDVKPTASNTTVWGNTIHHVWADYGSGAIITTNGNNTIIANNYIYDIHTIPNKERVCAIGTEADANIYIFNNIIANLDGGYGIFITPWFGTRTNYNILNNTLYNMGSGGSGIYCESGSYAVTGNIKNNIFKNTGDYGILWYGSGTKPSCDYNNAHGYAKAAWNGVTDGGHSILTDPLLNNPSGGNFTIPSNSPIVDKGQSQSSMFLVDLHGAADPRTFITWPNLSVTVPVSRPQGSGWGIGAYEYSINPPKNLKVIGQ